MGYGIRRPGAWQPVVKVEGRGKRGTRKRTVPFQVAPEEKVDCPRWWTSFERRRLETQPSPEQAALKAKLQGLEGSDFDKEHATAMIAAHRKNIEAFEAFVKSGSEAEIKGVATKALPTLRASQAGRGCTASALHALDVSTHERFRTSPGTRQRLRTQDSPPSQSARTGHVVQVLLVGMDARDSPRTSPLARERHSRPLKRRFGRHPQTQWRPGPPIEGCGDHRLGGPQRNRVVWRHRPAATSCPRTPRSASQDDHTGVPYPAAHRTSGANQRNRCVNTGASANVSRPFLRNGCSTIQCYVPLV
jgi:hypothetical protein